jgi:hypothetical protein
LAGQVVTVLLFSGELSVNSDRSTRQSVNHVNTDGVIIVGQTANKISDRRYATETGDLNAIGNADPESAAV